MEDLHDPAGYTGNAVWGSSPAIDTKRNQVYIATGNNYSVPDDVLQVFEMQPAIRRAAACLAATTSSTRSWRWT